MEKKITSFYVFIFFFLFFSVFSISSFADSLSILKYKSLLEAHERIPREFVVKTKSVAVLAREKVLYSSLGFAIESFRAFKTDPRFHLLRLQDGVDEAEFLYEINALSEVEYAEPNYVLHILDRAEDIPSVRNDVIPRDPDFRFLWGLHNTGQLDYFGNVGLAGADIGATKAWNFTTGSKNIVVAVLDTGVDFSHLDLAPNVYRNPGEWGDGKESDGIDNDGNGFVDDHTGWNFYLNNNNTKDDNSHGTHCAGIMGAIGNNGIGVAGVAWNVSIMPIKFLSGAGKGSLEHVIQSVKYATAMGVDIMSNSYGGGGHSRAMKDAIREANERGILFVAAAGNTGLNSDISPYYPASYPVDNVIAVAATDNQDRLASFSTFGKKSVHIAAPGENVYSTGLLNEYYIYSGTSMSVPYVAGALALLFSYDPSLSHLEAKDRLLRSRDPKEHLAGKIKHSGRLNVYNAINEIYLPSNEPKEADWVDGEAIEIIESAHPYTANADRTWVLKIKEKAKFIRLIFSRLKLESGFDFFNFL